MIRQTPRIPSSAMKATELSLKGAADFVSRPQGFVQSKVDITFVIPVLNEEDSLAELTDSIVINVPGRLSFEIIFIDDGSTDDSWIEIQNLADFYPEIVHGYRFRRNYGKAAALQLGFQLGEGKHIFTMDADLQDDPKEIPKFLAKMEEGFDLVCGWKRQRFDPWHKVYPSRIFNKMLSYSSELNLHDHNCGFKCYKGEVAKSIHLFGELHRMVPALVSQQGYKVGEITVTHHPRQHGKSKYGVERFLRGFSDMITVWFVGKFQERPAHFANICSAIFMFSSLLAMVAVFSLKGWGETALVGTLISSGIAGIFFMCGLFCELLIRCQGSKAKFPVIEKVCVQRSRKMTA